MNKPEGEECEVERLTSAKLVTTDAESAPFRIGEEVEVIGCIDESGYPELIGRKGKVVHFEYYCGGSQLFPCDPIIGVQIGKLPLKEFWQEELTSLEDQEVS